MTLWRCSQVRDVPVSRNHMEEKNNKSEKLRIHCTTFKTSHLDNIFFSSDTLIELNVYVVSSLINISSFIFFFYIKIFSLSHYQPINNILRNCKNEINIAT
jgi:hypothetical protein